MPTASHSIQIQVYVNGERVTVRNPITFEPIVIEWSPEIRVPTGTWETDDDQLRTLASALRFPAHQRFLCSPSGEVYPQHEIIDEIWNYLERACAIHSRPEDCSPANRKSTGCSPCALTMLLMIGLLAGGFYFYKKDPETTKTLWASLETRLRSLRSENEEEKSAPSPPPTIESPEPSPKLRLEPDPKPAPRPATPVEEMVQVAESAPLPRPAAPPVTVEPEPTEPPPAPTQSTAAVAASSIPAPPVKDAVYRDDGSFDPWIENPEALVLEIGTTSIRFILIPEGFFFMGHTQSEADSYNLETGKLYSATSPRHRIEMAEPFYMSQFEISEAQFGAVTGAAIRGGDNSGGPMANVSWIDATRFFDHINRKFPELNVRAPTEIEFEYCSRGEEGFRFATRDGKFPRKASTANVQESWCGVSGLFGSLTEWCASAFIEENYSSRIEGFLYLPSRYPKFFPDDSRDYSKIVIKGGFSLTTNPYLFEAAGRSWKHRSIRQDFLGFRAVITQKTEP